MRISYPTGVIPPKSKSRFHHQDHHKKRTIKQSGNRLLALWKSHYNKYNARKIHAFHHVFDSNVEYGFYLYLRFAEHAIFRVHVRFLIKPHHLTKSGIPIRKRSYTPDFVRYKTWADYKANRPYEVDDVKGVKQIPSADSMKFGDFEDARDIPVVIIRWENHHWIRQRKCF